MAGSGFEDGGSETSTCRPLRRPVRPSLSVTKRALRSGMIWFEFIFFAEGKNTEKEMIYTKETKPTKSRDIEPIPRGLRPPDLHQGNKANEVEGHWNQSQRDCVLQPRVARDELPWVNMPQKSVPNPNGVASHSGVANIPRMSQPRWG